VCREGGDARGVLEFYVADLDFLSGAGGLGVGVQSGHLEIVLAVGDDGPGEVVNLAELVRQANILYGAWIIFGGEEVVAVFEAESFAKVFEGIGVGPADADGFLGERKGLFVLRVDLILGENPVYLMWHEVLRELFVVV